MTQTEDAVAIFPITFAIVVEKRNGSRHTASAGRAGMAMIRIAANMYSQLDRPGRMWYWDTTA
eukprot:1672916-Amphidinium_carterae.1